MEDKPEPLNPIPCFFSPAEEKKMWEIAHKQMERCKAAGGKHKYNVAGYTDDARGNFDGLRSEIAVARFTCGRWNFRDDGKTDGGVDVIANGLTIQVKFNNYTWGDLYFKVTAFTTDLAVLVTPWKNVIANKLDVQIVGWTTFDEFQKKKIVKQYQSGGNNVWAMEQNNLRSPWGLRSYIESNGKKPDVKQEEFI